jgi:hypothetical protein
MKIKKSCDNCGQGDGCNWKSAPGYSMYEKCITKDHACWFPNELLKYDIAKEMINLMAEYISCNNFTISKEQVIKHFKNKVCEDK